MAKYSKRELLIAAVAILAITACGIKIWRSATASGRRRPSASATKYGQPSRPDPATHPVARRSDATEVVEWRLRAIPVLAPRDFPAIGATPSTLYCPQSTNGRGPTKCVRVDPAVLVQVEVMLEAATRQPVAIWPGAERLDIACADNPDGPFVSCGVLDREQLDAMPTATIMGEQRNRFGIVYQVFVLDRTAPTSKQRFYRACFVGSSAEVLAQSGVCAAAAVSIPEAEVDLEPGDQATVNWPRPDRTANSQLHDPAYIVAVTNPGVIIAYDPILTPQTLLTRTEAAAEGAFTTPVPLETNTTSPKQVAFALTGNMDITAWNSTVGEISARRRVGVCLSFVPRKPKRGRRPANVARPAMLIPSLTPNYGLETRPVENRYRVTYWAAPSSKVLDLLRTIGGRVPAESVLKNINLTNGPQEVWMVSPGAGARVDYTLHVEAGGSRREINTSLVSPARLCGVRTLPGDNSVRISWQPFEWVPENWETEPEIVVARTVAERATVTSAGVNALTPFAEIARLPATDTSWVDDSAKNGTQYLYALTVEGLTRATAYAETTGEFELLLPVRCGAGYPGVQRLPVNVVEPGPLTPIRIGITRVGPAEHNPLLTRAEQELLRVLGKEYWVQLVERSRADSLLDERSLGNLGAAPQETEPTEAITSDVLLRLTTRKLGRQTFLDVWLLDYRNFWRERLRSVPEADLDWKTLLSQTVQDLKAAFPDWAQRHAAPGETSTDTPPAIAVLGFAPRTVEAGAALPHGALQDLVEASVAQQGQWKVIERATLEQVVAELGLTGGGDNVTALRLGKLIKADVVLLGTYDVRGRDIVLDARLLDVGSGLQNGTFEVVDDAQAPENLASALVQQLKRVGPKSSGNREDLMRSMDARLATSAHDALAGAKRAAFVDPNDEDALAQMGAEYERQGKFDLAANSYQQAASAAVGKGDFPLYFYQSADRVLRRLQRPSQRVTLWQHALKSWRDGGRNVAAILAPLAEALCDAGRQDDARKLLQQTPPSQDDYRSLRVCERLGLLPNDPIDSYIEAPWMIHGYGSTASWHDGKVLGPNYAALIRLLRTREGSARIPALIRIACQLASERPYQSLRAADELIALDAADVRIAGHALLAALQTGNASLRERWLQELLLRQEDSPQTVEMYSRAARALQRKGLSSEAERVARLGLALNANGDGTETQRILMKQVLEKDGTASTEPAAREKSTFAVDEAVKTYIENGGGRKLGSDVCVLTESGIVVRLRLPDLSVVWTADLGLKKAFPELAEELPQRLRQLGNLNNTLWFTDDSLLVSNIPDGVLYSLAADTGLTRWTHTAWTSLSPPVVRPDRGWVSVANAFGDLSMISLSSGELLRHIPGPPELEPSFAERCPGLTAISFRGADNVAYQTDWLQFRYSDNLFTQRNFFSMRTPVWFTANPPPGPHRFNVADFTILRTPPEQKQPGNAKPSSPILDQSLSERERLQKIATSKWNRNPTSEIPALKDVAENSEESIRLRQSALTSLAQISPEDAVPLLASYAGGEDTELREAALYVLRTAIQRTGPGGPSGFRTDVTDEAVSRLAELCRSSDRELRRAAMVALANCRGKSARPLVDELLNDMSDPNRGRVALVLAEDGDASVIPILKTLRNRQLPPQRQLGLLTRLAVLGDKESQTILDGLVDLDAELKHAREATARGVRAQDIARAESAIRVIHECFPDPRYVEELEEFLDLLDGKLERTVCNTLACIDDPRVLSILIDRLPPLESPGSGLVRSVSGDLGAQTAAAALETLTGHGWGLDRQRWKRWQRRKAEN